MKKFWMAGGLAVMFLTATSGLALAQQITPSQGIAPKPSISQNGKGKGHHHGCHGKCSGNKGGKSSGN